MAAEQRRSAASGECPLPPVPSRRLWHLAGNLLLALAASVATYAALEMMLRLAAHRILPGGESFSTASIFRPEDDPVGYALEPGSSRILCAGGAYTVRDRINALGLRDVERRYANPSGIGRILLLGDSFTFGQGVPMEGCFARRMERDLRGVEVINSGVPGYGLDQEYLLYKDRAHRFGADLVLLVFFINDLDFPSSMDLVRDDSGLPVRFSHRSEVVARREAKAPHGLRGAISSCLRAHSLLYALVRDRLDTLRYRLDHPDAKPASHGRRPDYLTVFLRSPNGEAMEKWEHGFRTLDALRALVEGNGSQLAIASIPASWQLSEDRFDRWARFFGVDPKTISRTKPDEMLAEWCRRTGTPFLPLLDAFDGREGAGLYFPYDLHLDSRGHEIAAEAIEAFLRARHLVPGGGTGAGGRTERAGNPR